MDPEPLIPKHDGYWNPKRCQVVQFAEPPFSHGPYGAKNIAEPSMVPSASAILNAIYHATGRRVRDLPANLERVLLGKDLTKGGSAKACKLGLKT